MTGLAEWLREQIAEDRCVTRAATPGPWRWEGEPWEFDDGPPTPREHLRDLSSVELVSESHSGGVIWVHGPNCGEFVGVKRADADHVARHDPARELARLTVLEQLVHLHDQRRSREPDEPEHPCSQIDPYADCQTLMLVGLFFADCDGYRAEWAPE